MVSVLILLSVLSLASVADASNKCVWVEGNLKCKRDQSRVIDASVAIYDRDGRSIFDHLDKDDRMGVTTVTDSSGHFRVEGCGSDRDWLPFYSNHPEPYLRIRHYCSSHEGDDVNVLPPFDTFVPHTHFAGDIELD